MVKTFEISELDPDLIEPNTKGYMEPSSTGSKTVVIGKPGTGKCLHGDTIVLMYDTSSKLARNIVAGDLLMGDNCTPRKVTCVSKGKQPMFRIIQSHNFPYIVNQSHILTLYDTVAKKTIDMPLMSYFNLSPEQKELLRGYKVDLVFPSQDVMCDPLFTGYLYGIKNSEIGKYTEFFETNEIGINQLYTLRTEINKNIDKHFRDVPTSNFQKIPDCFKYNSHEVRESFFRGVLNACGWIKRNTNVIQSYTVSKVYYEGDNYILFSHDMKEDQHDANAVVNYFFPFNNSKFFIEFEFLAKSIGATCVRTSNNNLVIMEDNAAEVVDNLGEYRHHNGQQKLFLSTIAVHPIGNGSYYGFQIDSNKRFLLGDLTVTHNTTLISSLLYFKKDIFPCAEVYSGTEDSNHFYSRMMPSSFVYNKLDVQALLDYVKRQKIAKKYLPNPWSVCLLDDCTDDPSIFLKPLFQGIFKNGRHWKTWFIISLQYCMDIKPVIRTAIDGTFILKETNRRNRKSLWENYAGIFDSFNDFNTVMDEITEDYTALYIHNKNQSNDITDSVYYYRGTPPPSDFRFGCDNYWDHHKERYDIRYVDPIV